MMPASAASVTPRNEVSSQGCTTTVVAAGTCFARAMSRSYFEWDGSPSGPIAAMVPISPSLAGSIRPSTSPALRGCAFMMPSPVLACGRAA